MATRPLRDVYQGSEDLWGYRAAASTLASFELEHLLPFQGGASPEVRAQLLVECDVFSSDKGHTRWSLRTPVRQTTLRRLFEKGLLYAALQANPEREDSTTQRTFERCINLEGPSPALPQTQDDAAAMLEVSYWLETVPQLSQRMPARDSIRQFIEREQLLEPFRNLVGDHFAGRLPELETLSDYVGVFAAATVSEKIVRTFENIFSIRERPPLFVMGPGGSGKSTLIAKFVLDHAETAEHAQFPFAYLDFDRMALRAERPITLLLDVMRQLAIQYPQTKRRYKEIIANWTAPVSEQETANETARDENSAAELVADSMVESHSDEVERSTLETSHASSSGDQSRSEQAGFFHEFAEFVKLLQPASTNQPLLLVLDTFEEIQFRSSASEDDVFDLLSRLQELIPRLRSVICGRAEIMSTRYKVRELKLENFDEPAGLLFLEHLGIQNTELAGTIFKQVGGSPLVLRLAADVAKKEGAGGDGIKDLGSRWLELFRSESVEVVLYKRILSHVYDKRVRRLANPGLVLRYITPEVVLGVLGPACDVSIDGIPEARSLVRAMRQQLATILVPFGGTEKLAHRPDMRSILLIDLATRAKKDKALAAKLEQIHLRAIDFYAHYEDTESRAEELFHRLVLRQDRGVLKERWRDEAGAYLGSAVLELSPDVQGFVAARTGFDVSNEVWEQADEEDWVLIAARRVRELVRVDRSEEASKLLRNHVRSKEITKPGPPYHDMAEVVLSGLARSYEAIRRAMKPGDNRTRRMDNLVTQVRDLASDLQLDPPFAERFFSRGKEGDRVVGLGVAQASPKPENISLAIEAIGMARTPFEQFHGLVLASSLDELSQELQVKLGEALLSPKGVPIHESDPSRSRLRDRLLKKWPGASREGRSALS
jgi:Cdc6-like AAA superfamily ATPase